MNTQDIEAIANLKYNTGFKLLLSAIQARIDDIADEMHRAEISDVILHKHAKWVAFREILAELTFRPEENARFLKTALPTEDPDVVETKRNLDETRYMEATKAYYNQINKPMTSFPLTFEKLNK